MKTEYRILRYRTALQHLDTSKNHESKAKSLCAWISPSNLSVIASRATSQCSIRIPQDSASPSSRIALQIQYNGASFHGWESKPGLRTVESTLLDSVCSVTNTRCRVIAASRTDAGAHALGQVVHFDIPERHLEDAYAWVSALNTRLPPDVRVMRSSFTSHEFDARRSARWRHYRYNIRTTSSPNVFLAPLAWHYYQHELDVPSMNMAAQLLTSRIPRDMSAFRKARAAASHTNIQIRDITVQRKGALVQLDVTANWFVYGMMRLLAATLVQVGVGAISIQQFEKVVYEGKRGEVKFSAPACGLFLVNVEYPQGLCPFQRDGGEDDGASEVQMSLGDFELSI